MALSKRLRYEVMRRDAFTCRYCGGGAPEVELTVDHVQPTTLGGSDEASNLVTACASCNAGKSSSAPDAPIVDGVSDDALRWARAMQLAADVSGKERKRIALEVQEFDVWWCEWRDGSDEPLPRPTGWEQSVEMWVRAGISVADLVDGIRIAMAKQMPNVRVWRYFCGVIWRRLEARQDVARHLIDTDQV